MLYVDATVNIPFTNAITADKSSVMTHANEETTASRHAPDAAFSFASCGAPYACRALLLCLFLFVFCLGCLYAAGLLDLNIEERRIMQWHSRSVSVSYPIK
jgi:hypothetical protein